MVSIEAELDLATNMMGRLSDEIRERLRTVVNDPSEKNWSLAANILLNRSPMVTLFSAVCAIDPSYVSAGPTSTINGKGKVVRLSGWAKIPSSELLVQAIQYATH